MGMFFLGFVLTAIFFTCLATMVRDGLWSNAVKFINVMTAALLATSMFEALADLLRKINSSFDFLWDFMSVWMLFVLFMLIFRTAAGFASRTRVRFKRPLDVAGGIFFGLCVGWVMVCFTTMSLHTIPLKRNFFGKTAADGSATGGFQATPETKMFLMAPDRKWLAFVHTLSQGSLRSIVRPEENVFDPQGDFVLKWAARRERLEGLRSLRYRRHPDLYYFERLRPGMSESEINGMLSGPAARTTSGAGAKLAYPPAYESTASDGTGDGMRFQIHVRLVNNALVEAYIEWELQPGSFIKDPRSVIGGRNP